MEFLRLLADQRCAACERRGSILCGACRRGLPWLQGPLCVRCGEPDPQARLTCGVCARLGRAVATARSAVVHHAAGAALVHAWKDGARGSVAPLAAACVLAVVPRPAADVIVAVPAARDRAAWRGVDGPRTLASLLGQAWGVPVCDRVVARVHEAAQRGRSASARRRNAAHAFRVTGVLRGRVLLVDDVLTTGATARAVAERLRTAGASRVDVVTFARVATIL